MDPRAGEELTPTMPDPESRLPDPGRGLAFLRIVVGLWFAKGAVTKLSGFIAFGFLPLPRASERWVEVMPRLLTRYAESAPLDRYAAFLHDTVIPNAPLFANLTALGETIVGLGLTLGAATPVASGIGFLLMVNYLLATFGVGPCQQGFHILLVACMVVFAATRAGRTWGVDGWARRRWPRSLLVRWPLS